MDGASALESVGAQAAARAILRDVLRNLCQNERRLSREKLKGGLPHIGGISEDLFREEGGLAQAVPPVYQMETRSLVPYAGEVVLHDLKTDGKSRLVVVGRSGSEDSRCPGCVQPSQRNHSRYKRN